MSTISKKTAGSGMDISLYLDMASRTVSSNDQNKQQNMSTAVESGDSAIAEIFEGLSAFINEDLVKQIKGVFVFNVKGEPKPWFVDLKNGKGKSGQGQPPHADVTFNLDRDTFIKMFSGTLNPTNAFMSGKLSLKGDLPTAMKLDKIMGQMRSKL